MEKVIGVVSGSVRLCKLMNRETNSLLLDEPTNHLDTDAKDELKRALKEYGGSILRREDAKDAFEQRCFADSVCAPEYKLFAALHGKGDRSGQGRQLRQISGGICSAQKPAGSRL